MPVLPLIANKDPREVVELKSHQRVLTALQKWRKSQTRVDSEALRGKSTASVRIVSYVMIDTSVGSNKAN